jgi:hypothetical protein
VFNLEVARSHGLISGSKGGLGSRGALVALWKWAAAFQSFRPNRHAAAGACRPWWRWSNTASAGRRRSVPPIFAPTGAAKRLSQSRRRCLFPSAAAQCGFTFRARAHGSQWARGSRLCSQLWRGYGEPTLADKAREIQSTHCSIGLLCPLCEAPIGPTVNGSNGFQDFSPLATAHRRVSHGRRTFWRGARSLAELPGHPSRIG